MQETKSAFEEYQRQNKTLRLDNYQLEGIKTLTSAGALADQIAHHATWTLEEKQAVLDASGEQPRLMLVLQHLTRDLERFNMDKKVAGRVKEQMDANQREYYLREQMKAIGKELGGGEEGPAEVEALREKIEAAGMPAEVKEKALKELARLERTPGGSPEGTVVRNYIDWLTDVPWSKRDEEILDIVRTRTILDDDHYGLDDVKERILEFLAVRQLTHKPDELDEQGEKKQRTAEERIEDSELRAPILCLVGPPGVGKTSLGKSIARSLNRKFVRMSLGGMRDEAEIRGHRRTYIGSMPGRIIQGMKNASVVNPIMLLDEIDKMASDWRGDPSSAMLEVLDPEQNHTFQDHYLEVPYDLSQVMFITTANSLQTIPRPLLDRMEIIQIPGYTMPEKLQIAKRYRLPRQLRGHGLEGRLEVTDAALQRIIEEYTQEAGVRNVDRMISKLARKAARALLETPWEGVKTVDAENVPDYLGIPLFKPDRMEKEAQVGVAQGLAWTSVGGTMLVVEALATPGTGRINMTGSLGDVMKESVQAAVAYLRKHATEYGADPEFYKNTDLHVHFPDGATPKDGPSAGITIATAVISAITGRPARMDIAMTGEISLRGRVLPIGGVKEEAAGGPPGRHPRGHRAQGQRAEPARPAREHPGRTEDPHRLQRGRGLGALTAGRPGAARLASPDPQQARPAWRVELSFPKTTSPLPRGGGVFLCPEWKRNEMSPQSRTPGRLLDCSCAAADAGGRAVRADLRGDSGAPSTLPKLRATRDVGACAAGTAARPYGAGATRRAEISRSERSAR